MIVAIWFYLKSTQFASMITASDLFFTQISFSSKQFDHQWPPSWATWQIFSRYNSTTSYARQRTTSLSPDFTYLLCKFTCQGANWDPLIDQYLCWLVWWALEKGFCFLCLFILFILFSVLFFLSYMVLFRKVLLTFFYISEGLVCRILWYLVRLHMAHDWLPSLL